MKKKKTPKIELQSLVDMEANIKLATFAIRVIDNKYRKQIIHAIHELGEPSVTELYTHLGMRQEVCSIHLQSLRKLGLVNCRRDKKYVFYSLREENIVAFLEILGKLAEQLKFSIPSI